MRYIMAFKASLNYIIFCLDNGVHLRLTFKKLIKKIIKDPPNTIFNLSSRRNYFFLKKLLNNKENIRILFVGSGYKRGYGVNCLGEDLLKKSINLDIKPMGIVDIVGDVHHLPFKNETFDAVIAQAVICYLKNPFMAISEIKRILKKGGYIYTEIAFIHRYDGADLFRCTKKGLRELFKEFSLVDEGIVGGPSSAFSNILVKYLAILFSCNIDFLFNSFDTLFRWLLCPLKYLDLILKNNKFSSIIAHSHYFLGRKK